MGVAGFRPHPSSIVDLKAYVRWIAVVHPTETCCTRLSDEMLYRHSRLFVANEGGWQPHASPRSQNCESRNPRGLRDPAADDAAQDPRRPEWRRARRIRGWLR